MDEMLKQAVVNSKVKKYHGTLDEMNELPATDVQIKVFKGTLPRLEDVFRVTQTKVQGKNSQYETTVDVLKPDLTEEQWRAYCSERWPWISDEIFWNEKITATEVSRLANQRTTLGVRLKDRLQGVLIKDLQESTLSFEVG
jgi:hypothetical protein